MNPENEQAKPKRKKIRTQREKKAYDAFKHRMTVPFAKLGYRVDFKIETKDGAEIVLARLVDPRIGLWAIAETPLRMLTNNKLFEVSIVGATQTLWERMGEGLRGMQKDQKCWLRLKARRDRRRKEEPNGKEEGGQEEHGPGIINFEDAKARARARKAGLYVP